jgi:predicted CXXCH cytochrome family protein
VVQADLFNGSSHAESLEEIDEPGCSACHSNHLVERTSDKFLGMGDDAICADCHLDDDEGGEVAIAMRALVDSLVTGFEAADSILEEAENVGMEVSQAQFELGDARHSLVTARTVVHAFTVEAVSEEVEAGLEVTDRAYERGLAALRELRFRRAGLAVSSVIILILIVGLLLKIREAEAKAEGTLDSVRSFFFEAMTREGSAVSGDLRLAACAVLLELAYADRRFADSERSHLEELIRRQFDLDTTQAAKLIQIADRERTEARDISQFTGLIAEGFTAEQKTALLKDMWSLVLSDGELARREEYLVGRIARLLGLGSAAVADVRREVGDG